MDIFFKQDLDSFLFYFPFSSLHTPHPPLSPSSFVLSPPLAQYLETSQSRCRRGKKHSAFRERAEMWGGMASTPHPQPTPRGHGDPSVVSALAHAQRMGNKTLCVVCLDIPPSAHTTLRMTSFPWVLGVPLASVLANPGIFGASVPFSPGRLLFRGGIQVSCL